MMATAPAIGGITVGPCQVCNEVKQKFYLCTRIHSTCESCKELRKESVPEPSEESPRSPATKRVTFSPRKVEEDFAEDPEIFCEACDAFVDAALVTLSSTKLESTLAEDTELVGVDDLIQDFEEVSTDLGFEEPPPGEESYGDDTLRQDVDNLKTGLATTYAELMETREDLDEVICKSEKLGLDVDMLRHGVNYVYINFDSVLRREEVRFEEKICGIPFVVMVRMRLLAGLPSLGFFVGLEPSEGLAHSPLKKTIVLRAHNAYGKVIEKLTIITFEKGHCVHPCFDLTEPPIRGMYGYADFLKKDRILKPDVLKDGRLCLSLQIKPLQYV